MPVPVWRRVEAGKAQTHGEESRRVVGEIWRDRAVAESRVAPEEDPGGAFGQACTTRRPVRASGREKARAAHPRRSPRRARRKRGTFSIDSRRSGRKMESVKRQRFGRQRRHSFEPTQDRRPMRIFHLFLLSLVSAALAPAGVAGEPHTLAEPVPDEVRSLDDDADDGSRASALSDDRRDDDDDDDDEDDDDDAAAAYDKAAKEAAAKAYAETVAKVAKATIDLEEANQFDGMPVFSEKDRSLRDQVRGVVESLVEDDPSTQAMR